MDKYFSIQGSAERVLCRCDDRNSGLAASGLHLGSAQGLASFNPSQSALRGRASGPGGLNQMLGPRRLRAGLHEADDRPIPVQQLGCF